MKKICGVCDMAFERHPGKSYSSFCDMKFIVQDHQLLGAKTLELPSGQADEMKKTSGAWILYLGSHLSDPTRESPMAGVPLTSGLRQLLRDSSLSGRRTAQKAIIPQFLNLSSWQIPVTLILM